MRKRFSLIISTIALTLFAGFASAQIVSGNLFLQGKYVEIGALGNGALGSGVSAPTGYHPRGGTAPYCVSGISNMMASVCDWGKDGWTTGTPAYMGDYTLPGTPWEEWDIETGGTVCVANTTRFGSCAASGTLTGSFTSYSLATGSLGPWYSNWGTRALGTWTGSVGSGSALTIRKEYRVDTLGMSCVFTVVLTNTTSSTITGVYYMRTCDPDNDEPISGGSFATNNVIHYQNDYYHRVMVDAYATGTSAATGIPAAPYGLGTKDCRAKAVIFQSWPLATGCDLGAIWAETAGCLGTAHYAVNVNTVVYGDIAIGLVFNLGDIAAHDSVIFSYAYIYDGVLGVDSAFPNPRMVINGVGYDSFALLTACGTSLGDTLPIDILYGTDKCWSWSHWTWTGSSAAAMAALLTDTGVVNGIIVPSLTTTVTYTVTGTQSMSDCAAKTFIITLIPSSLGPPGVADVYYCEGATAAALTATGIHLLWYTTPTGGTGSTTAPIPSTATPGVYTYYVSQNPCGVESARARITVYVTPRPTMHPTNNGPICAGNALILYSNDTFTTGTRVYSWTGPGTFTSASHNPVIGGATVADSGMYVVTLSVNGCSSLPDTEFAVVHAAPSPPAVTPVTYCQFAPAVPLIATGANLLWYTTSSGGTGSPVAPIPSTAGGNVTYWVTQTTNGCESGRAALLVTVNPKPAAPLAPRPTYCQFDTPSPLSATGTALLWYGPGVSGSSIAPTPSTTTPGILAYYVTQTLLGCVSDSSYDPVTIIAQPSAPAVVDTTYCQFAPSVALSASGADISWYTTPAGGTALTTAPVPATATVGTTTWYVTQTVNGCESRRSPVTATILYLPVFSITLSRPYVCQFDTLTFSYSGPSLTNPVYTWTTPTGATYVSGVPTDPSVVVRFDSLFFQQMILTAADFGGKCKTSDTIPVHVVYEPGALALLNTTQNLCLGDTLTVALTTHSSNADHYTWDFDGGTVITANSNSGGPYTVSWSDSGVHIIKLTAFTTEGCPGKPTYDTIKIHSLPDGLIVVPTGTSGMCMEDSILLKASSTDYSYSYTWLPAHFFNENNKDSIWGKIETRGYVTLIVTDAYGCRSMDSILLSPDACCTVTFPTAFTPNNDGKNDYFRPIMKGYHRFHEFRVVNRWGQTVFEANDSKMEWDGKFGGVPQDMGVYYYFIKYDCEGNTDAEGNVIGRGTFTQKGEVTLIR